MKKISIAMVVFIALAVMQCVPEKDSTFVISENQIGKLLKTATVSELEAIFVSDSIVKDTASVTLAVFPKKIEIFEKGGAHLLSLTPNTDSVPGIENIRIVDKRYTTDKGIGIASSFKDIKDNYSIKKVSSSLNNVVVFLKESDLYITIDKKELPADLRYVNTPIDAVQIPDEAKIKYLMIGWN